MPAIKVHDLLRRRALVTRESAAPLRSALEAIDIALDELVLDFSGIDAVTPSFVDEVLAVVEGVLKQRKADSSRVRVINPPTRLSAKFLAVGRARGLHIHETASRSWVVTLGPPA